MKIGREAPKQVNAKFWRVVVVTIKNCLHSIKVKQKHVCLLKLYLVKAYDCVD